MKRLYFCELRVNNKYSSRYVLARNTINACDLIVEYYNLLYPDCIITDIQFTPVEYVSQEKMKKYINQFDGRY